MSNENIFKRSCLIQLSTSIWQGSRAIEPALLEQNNEWLKARKLLINPELLGPIRTCAHQARKTVQQYSLPFPITSIYLVPKETLSMIDERLNAFKERFWNKVNDFVDQYELAREDARSILGDFFDETDYPENIITKFNFEWRFLILGLPGKTGVLSPEIYEREKQKFVTLMEETRDLAMAALRGEFGEIISHLLERLDGKPKTVKSSMLNRLKDFLDAFDTRNVFQDEVLHQLVQEAKAVVNGISPYGLQYNEGMRNRIVEDMNRLRQAVDEAIEDIPRRKLRMAV